MKGTHAMMILVVNIHNRNRYKFSLFHTMKLTFKHKRIICKHNTINQINVKQ